MSIIADPDIKTSHYMMGLYETCSNMRGAPTKLIYVIIKYRWV